MACSSWDGWLLFIELLLTVELLELLPPLKLGFDFRLSQPSNAHLLMLVTLSGIVTDVSPTQPSNAQLAMLVTGWPPSLRCIVMLPEVVLGTARWTRLPSMWPFTDVTAPTRASPLLTVYVHDGSPM